MSAVSLSLSLYQLSPPSPRVTHARCRICENIRIRKSEEDSPFDLTHQFISPVTFKLYKSELNGLIKVKIVVKISLLLFYNNDIILMDFSNVKIKWRDDRISNHEHPYHCTIFMQFQSYICWSRENIFNCQINDICSLQINFDARWVQWWQKVYHT